MLHATHIDFFFLIKWRTPQGNAYSNEQWHCSQTDRNHHHPGKLEPKDKKYRKISTLKFQLEEQTSREQSICQPCPRESCWGKQGSGSSAQRWRQGGSLPPSGEPRYTGLQSGPWKPSSSQGMCRESAENNVIIWNIPSKPGLYQKTIKLIKLNLVLSI